MRSRVSAAVLMLTLVVVLSVGCGSDGDEAQREVPPRSPEAAAACASEIDTPSPPYRVAAGDGMVWAALDEGMGLARIDPATNQVVATVAAEPHSFTSDIAIGEGAIWVLQDGLLKRIEPTTNMVTGSTDLEGSLGTLAVGEGAVWLRSFLEVTRVDAATGAVVASIPVDGAGNVAVGSGALWVVDSDPVGDRLLRIDPATNVATEEVALSGIDGYNPPSTVGPWFAADDGAVWVAGGGVLIRVDPSEHRIADVIDLRESMVDANTVDVGTEGLSGWRT